MKKIPEEGFTWKKIVSWKFPTHHHFSNGPTLIEKIQRPDFFARPVYFYWRCHGNCTYVSLTINLLPAISGDQKSKGFREKGE